MNRLFGLGLGKCCECACCGGDSCEAWSELWTSESEALANGWAPAGFTVNDNKVFEASIRRSRDGVWFIETSIGSFPSAVDMVASVEIDVPDASPAFNVLAIWNGSVTEWTLFIDGVPEILSPSNPDEVQIVTFWWNSLGEYEIQVGDETRRGVSLNSLLVTEIGVLVSGSGFVGSIEATCIEYDPELFDAWETQDGLSYLTQDGEEWEMQYA